MSEAEQGGGAAGGGEGGGAGAAAVVASGGEAAASSWRDTLPDALKADASLANFADVGALAQGYLETKRAATARAPDYSTEAGLNSFADAVRPADAAAYEIPVPEGQTSPIADDFRAFAHKIGMPPAWAKATAEFFNETSGKFAEAEAVKGQQEVDSFKSEMGASKFAEKLQGVQRDLKAAGVQLSDEDLAQLDAKIGSKNLLQYLFWVNDRVGEPAPVEGAAGAGSSAGALTPAQAEAQWNEKVKDADWRAKVKVQGSPEQKESQRLTALIASGRAQKRNQP